MIEGYKNRAVRRSDIKTEDVVVPLADFFFPQHSITIHARNKHEALIKLEEHLKALAINK